MRYMLTNGQRQEFIEADHYDEVLEAARAWAACTDADVRAFELPEESTPYLTVNHETGEAR